MNPSMETGDNRILVGLNLWKAICHDKKPNMYIMLPICYVQPTAYICAQWDTSAPEELSK